MENIILILIGLFMVSLGAVANIVPTKPDTVKNLAKGKENKDAFPSDSGPPAPVDKALLNFGSPSKSTKNDSPAVNKDNKPTDMKPSVPKSPDVKTSSVKQPKKTKSRRSRRRRRRRKRKSTSKPRKTTNVNTATKAIPPKTPPPVVFEPFPTGQKESSAKSSASSTNVLPESSPSSKPPNTKTQKEKAPSVSVASLISSKSPSAFVPVKSLKSSSKSVSRKSPSTVAATQSNTDTSSILQSKQNTPTKQTVSSTAVSQQHMQMPALSGRLISNQSPLADMISQMQMTFPSQSLIQNGRSFLTQRFGPLAKLMMMGEYNEAQSEMMPLQRMVIRGGMPGGLFVQQGLIQKAAPRKLMTNLDVMMGIPPGQPKNIQNAETIMSLPSVADSTALKGNGVHNPIELLQKSMLQEPQMSSLVDKSKPSASQQTTQRGMASQGLPNNEKTKSIPKESRTNTAMLNNGNKMMLSPLEILQRPFIQQQGVLPMELLSIGQMPAGPMSIAHMPMESFGPMAMGPLQGLLTGGAPGVPQIPQSASSKQTLQSLPVQSANASVSSVKPNIMNVMQQRIQRDLCLSETPVAIRAACSLTPQPTSTKPQCNLNMKCVELGPGVGGCCARSRQHANMLDDWVELNLPERFHR